MLLRDKIKKLNHSFFKDFSPGDLSVLQNGITHLLNLKMEDNAILTGTTIPFFSLPDSTGDMCDIAERLQKGPLILSFYRGRWCPYCNLELRAYDDVMDDIEELGASLVAVSPQTLDHARKTARMNDLEYDLLSDAGNRVARSFGLVFEVPDEMKDVYRAMACGCPIIMGTTHGNCHSGNFCHRSKGKGDRSFCKRGLFQTGGAVGRCRVALKNMMGENSATWQWREGIITFQ